MKPPRFLPLLSPRPFAKTVFMDVTAVATFGSLRFMLHDFASSGEEPNYYLNVAELESEEDLIGLNVGHPIKIEPGIVRAGLEAARLEGLDDERRQLMVIAHVLCGDRIEEKLAEKKGGLPPEMDGFFATMRSLDEAEAIESLVAPPSSDIKAAPKRI